MWCPSVRYSTPFGPITTVFIGAIVSAVSLPTGTVQVKVDGSVSVAPGWALAASCWPLASHQSANFLLIASFESAAS